MCIRDRVNNAIVESQLSSSNSSYEQPDNSGVQMPWDPYGFTEPKNSASNSNIGGGYGGTFPSVSKVY